MLGQHQRAAVLHQLAALLLGVLVATACAIFLGRWAGRFSFS